MKTFTDLGQFQFCQAQWILFCLSVYINPITHGGAKLTHIFFLSSLAAKWLIKRVWKSLLLLSVCWLKIWQKIHWFFFFWWGGYPNLARQRRDQIKKDHRRLPMTPTFYYNSFSNVKKEIFAKKLILIFWELTELKQF